MEDSEIAGIRSALSKFRVSSLHGVESKGYIDLARHKVIPQKFERKTLLWDDCKTLVHVVRLYTTDYVDDGYDEDDFNVVLTVTASAPSTGPSHHTPSKLRRPEEPAGTGAQKPQKNGGDSESATTLQAEETDPHTPADK